MGEPWICLMIGAGKMVGIGGVVVVEVEGV